MIEHHPLGRDSIVGGPAEQIREAIFLLCAELDTWVEDSEELVDKFSLIKAGDYHSALDGLIEDIRRTKERIGKPLGLLEDDDFIVPPR